MAASTTLATLSGPCSVWASAARSTSASMPARSATRARALAKSPPSSQPASSSRFGSRRARKKVARSIMMPTEITDSPMSSQRTGRPQVYDGEKLLNDHSIRSFPVPITSLKVLRDPALAVASVAHDAVERERSERAGEHLEGPALQIGCPGRVRVADARLRAGRLVPGDGRLLLLAAVEAIEAAVVVGLRGVGGERGADELVAARAGDG